MQRNRLYRARYTKIIDGERVCRQSAKWYAKLKIDGKWKAVPLTTDEVTSRAMLTEVEQTVANAGRIYFIRAGEFVKIGFTYDLKKRIYTLQNGSAVKLELLHSKIGTLAEEKMLHAMFAKDRVRNQHEWFRLSPEILAYVGLSTPSESCLAGCGEALLHWQGAGGAA